MADSRTELASRASDLPQGFPIAPELSAGILKNTGGEIGVFDEEAGILAEGAEVLRKNIHAVVATLEGDALCDNSDGNERREVLVSAVASIIVEAMLPRLLNPRKGEVLHEVKNACAGIILAGLEELAKGGLLGLDPMKSDFLRKKPGRGTYGMQDAAGDYQFIGGTGQESGIIARNKWVDDLLAEASEMARRTLNERLVMSPFSHTLAEVGEGSGLTVNFGNTHRMSDTDTVLFVRNLQQIPGSRLVFDPAYVSVTHGGVKLKGEASEDGRITVPIDGLDGVLHILAEDDLPTDPKPVAWLRSEGNEDTPVAERAVAVSALKFKRRVPGRHKPEYPGSLVDGYVDLETVLSDMAVTIGRDHPVRLKDIHAAPEAA